jgi:hypothetical protein
LKIRLLDPLVCLLKELEEIRFPLDRQNVPAQSRQNAGVSTKARSRIDYRSITASQELGKGMPSSGEPLEPGTNSLPGAIFRPAKFQAFRAVFQHDVR